MVQAASSTTVGAGKSASGGKASSPRAGAGSTTARSRKGAGSSAQPARRAAGGGGPQNMWRFYTEDSPGIKVGPVPVLVMSLLFIASVFMLHIWGKYTRSWGWEAILGAELKLRLVYEGYYGEKLQKFKNQKCNSHIKTRTPSLQWIIGISCTQIFFYFR